MQKSNIKKGDRVRFLNAVGGGVVTRIDASRGMVFVEDEDGFEIPVLDRECVVVPKVNETTNFPVKDFSSSARGEASTQSVNQQVLQQPQTVKSEPEPVFETPDGDMLKLMLAFIPTDIKNLQTCDTDVLLINDSNYFLFYNLSIGEDDGKRSVSNGMLEPNTQEELARIAKNQLNDWENVQVQAIAFKRGKTYNNQQAIDKNVHIAPLKMYKLHTYGSNDYFEEDAWLIDLVTPEQLMPEIKPEEIKKALYEKEQPQQHKQQQRTRVNLNPDVIEVDLHIHELTDMTAGLTNADMLQMQLDKFHAVIAENIKKRGQKIVFIHGKGEGVLRSEILKLLKTRYKSFYYQDASFREYGFGATMVVIR
jgi:DNA-nicking Smr family endonuclease